MSQKSLFGFLGSWIFFTVLATSQPLMAKPHTNLAAEYVIVGGGTAGCALAKLLSQNNSVILLEGGDDQNANPLLQDPLNAFTLDQYINQFFWGIGRNQPNDSQGRAFPAIAGEVLGGGSSVNGMQYVLGVPSFYTELMALVGDAAWGSTNVYNTFTAIETFDGTSPATRGTTGPVDVRQCTADAAAAADFVTAFNVAATTTTIVDYNAPLTPVGSFEEWQLTQQPNQNRESSATAYLTDYIARIDDNVYKSFNRNLTVYTKARVDQICLSTSGGQPRARGVRAIVKGQEVVFQATKKVILCSGALQTPYLLMTSGIGDPTVLNAAGIPVICPNINVGQHLLNHIYIPLVGIGTVDGPVTDPKAFYSGGAFTVDTTRADPDRGLEWIVLATPGVATGSVFLAPLLLDALSQGSVTINTNDPLRMPLYRFNYLSDPGALDLASLVAAYRIGYNTLLGMGLAIADPTAPLPAAPDTDIETWILANYDQAYHWTGTCRMATTPVDGVVDSSGNVFGVSNLVIADNSIMPLNFLGNTQACAYLIGNIIAQKLLAE